MEILYEAMLVLDPTQSDEELSATIEQIKSIVIRADGQVVSAFPLYMRRRLACQLANRTEGTYVMVYFHGAAAVDQLKQEMEMSPVVLRCMIVRANPKALWIEGPPAPPPDRSRRPEQEAAADQEASPAAPEAASETPAGVEEAGPAEAETPKAAESAETEPAAEPAAEPETAPADSSDDDAAEAEEASADAESPQEDAGS